MIVFRHPEAFLLPVAIALLLRRRLLHGSATVDVLRVLVLALATLVLAEPMLHGSRQGRDLVFVIDRSRSMPADTLRAVRELAEHAVRQQQPGDRIGVVAFARDAVVEVAPRADFAWVDPTRTLEVDGTDLALGVTKALALVPPGRRATLFVVSDGETTGADPAGVAHEALAAGVRIDARVVRRTVGLDVAVEDVAVPGDVAEGEPFQFTAWVRADAGGEVTVRLRRDGVVLAEGKRTLRAGRNRLSFRDRVVEPGIHRYEVEVESPGDQARENDCARAVVRVRGPFRVLAVTPNGRADRLTRALATAGIAVVVVPPASAPLRLDALDGFGAVVLEDVAAADLPEGAFAAVQRWVRDLGGGLLMTGGAASFGQGGYHRSPIEEVLPVSMEIRDEQRKHALALALALDRSGSMQMELPDGTRKMELADRGACAAIELLGRADTAAVIAVDSAPHVVVPLTPVVDKAAIADRVLRIEAMGGGIYVEAALKAAARELVGASQGTKHIVLFADAADAEQPGDYRTLVPKLAVGGISVSVIALGHDTDADAALLEEIARLGGGRCFFVENAADLPRVFAQETIQVARSSLVEEPTAVRVRPDLLALGALGAASFPSVGGYSIAYAKDRAAVGLVTEDEQSAPLFSFWQHGLGRSAAFLGEVDGRLSGALGEWDGFTDFFATVCRWLGGARAGDAVYADFVRRGHEGVLSVEVEPGQEVLLPRLAARVLLPDGRGAEVTLLRAGERRLEARVPLTGEGVYRATVAVEGAGEVVSVPPITLPYSPEFERRLDPEAGARELARLVGITGGRIDPPVGELFSGSRDGVGLRPLAPLCAWLLLAALLGEIAVRRLGLSLPRVVRQKPASAREAARPSPATAAANAAVPEERPARAHRDERRVEGLGSILQRSKERAGRQTDRR